MDKGWIKLYRCIREHWIFNEKPYSKFKAWVDILMMANHKDNKLLLGNELVEVKRGSFITSELKLMERWGWSKTKVRNFLNLLEKDNMIIKKADKKKTTLTVVNYSDYQDIETTKEPQEDHEKTTRRPYKNTNKNVKNVKNVKNDKEVYKYIVEYLNQKANKNFKATTRSTQSKINARINEDFTIEDFKKVVDIKCSQWLGTEMEKYLRPETLFGTKFESYLNEKEGLKSSKVADFKKPTKFHNFEQRTDKYSEAELERLARMKRVGG